METVAWLSRPGGGLLVSLVEASGRDTCWPRLMASPLLGMVLAWAINGLALTAMPNLFEQGLWMLVSVRGLQRLRGNPRSQLAG